MRVKKAGGGPPKGKKQFYETLEEDIKNNIVAEPLGKAFQDLLEVLSPLEKESDKNSAFVKYLSEVLEITELDESSFCAWSGSNAWAYIFNQTAIALERSFTDTERILLLDQCERFVKSSRRTPIFQEIFVLSGLIDYLKSHSIDPCNLFVSHYPSEIMLRFQYIHPQKEKGIGEEEEEEEGEEEEEKEGRKRKGTGLFEAREEDWFSAAPEKAFKRKQRIISSSFTPSLDFTSPTSPRKQRLTPSLYPSPSCSPPRSSSPPLCPLLLNPQLIASFKGDNFDSLQSLVSRWDNVKDCQNFAEIEISILKKLLGVTLAHSPGELVAVEIDEIPDSHRGLFTSENWKQKAIWKSVFCRIKRCLPSSQQVEVWITPEEDIFVVVPESAIISFDWEKIQENEILPQSGKGSIPACVGNPLLYIHNEVHESMEEQAKLLLKGHGISFGDRRARLTSFEEVWENHQKLHVFIQKGGFLGQENEEKDGTEPSTALKELEEEVEEWLKELPLFSYKHFYSPRTFLRDVKHMTSSIEFDFEAIFRRELGNSSGILEALRAKLFAIAEGRRKDAVCGWWLSKIEEKSREFLHSQKGFVGDVLPPDYTDRPPQNLEAVASNLEIIQKLLVSKELKEFVSDLIQTIYTVLDTFLGELEFYLDPKTPDLMAFEGDLGIEEIFKPEIVEAVKEDFEYLQKMKDMDMEISLNSQSEGEEEEEEEVKRRIEMTDVVPVGGLIMARFHMEEVEHSTAMDLWGDTLNTRTTTRLGSSQVKSIKVAKRIHRERLSFMETDPDHCLADLLPEPKGYPPIPSYSVPVPSMPPCPPSPPTVFDFSSESSPTLDSQDNSAFPLHPSYSYSCLPPVSSVPLSPPAAPSLRSSPSPSSCSSPEFLPTPVQPSPNNDQKMREMVLGSLEVGKEMGLFDLLGKPTDPFGKAQQPQDPALRSVSPSGLPPPSSPPPPLPFYASARQKPLSFMEFLGLEPFSPPTKQLDRPIPLSPPLPLPSPRSSHSPSPSPSPSPSSCPSPTPPLSRYPSASFHRATSPPNPIVSSPTQPGPSNPREVRPLVVLGCRSPRTVSPSPISSSPPSTSGSLSPRPRSSMNSAPNARRRLPPKQTSEAHFFSNSFSSSLPQEPPSLSSSLPQEPPSLSSSSTSPPPENQRPYLAPRQQSFSSFTNYKAESSSKKPKRNVNRKQTE